MKLYPIPYIILASLANACAHMRKISVKYMRIELWLSGIAAAVLANMYYDGKLLKQLFTYTKYYKMMAVAIGFLVVYYILKYCPTSRANKLLTSANEYVKYLPVDKSTSSFIAPILDFTSKSQWGDVTDGPILALGGNDPVSRIQASGGNSGGGRVKRSVSETKKKFVAARQDWKCASCGSQLSAFFDTNHIRSLQAGGHNSVDNLEALCKNCHGQKTGMEIMQSSI